MNKFKRSINIIVFLIILVFSNSCADKKSRTIIGIWKQVPMTESNDTIKWSFFDGNQVIIQRNTNTQDTAEYTISSNVLEYYVSCDGFPRPEDPDAIAASYDGKYRIDQLDTRVLKLQRIANGDGSTDKCFRYLEFERSQ